MSFRLRAVSLLMLVALVATAATAWLTWRQATGQVEKSVTAGQQEVARITGALREYGYVHGTWDGLSPTVSGLAKDTGQRIRVATESDVLLADSDALAGREPRKVSRQPPVLVDSRPDIRLPEGLEPRTALKRTVGLIGEYRSTVHYAACLTRAGARVSVHPDGSGLPQINSDHSSSPCVKSREMTDPESDRVHEAVSECEFETPLNACLQRVFKKQIVSAAPPRLEVRLGVLDESPPTLAAAPAVGVAAGVALAVILGALLLSRAVLRPIHALTLAARRLGEGELSRRVPASGKDEIAELGRAFNRMAISIQDGEQRQRRLTGDIAHELRTPLANLRGYLEALQDGFVEPTSELFDSLHEEVMLQQRIVDDLQDLALAEAGALTYHRADIDLRELLETCRVALRTQAESAGVVLVVEATHPVHVHADADRLRQVVGNLVGNALRATAPGGTVTLALVPQGELVIVEVRDTGKGIPADDLPHLFDRFWRADASRGRATGGSGLGLSIARQIVTDHRGSIDVRSTVGAGTSFTIVLAVAGTANGLQTAPAAAS
ncbi:sensor histidine kinase [Streptomyces albipurpureus]|uniref:histidine kinase n=1 Tax=Streptomyces albipurpureus TaxID=2897419 RepID=A0ABT0V188_9ACTN|nr:ATP-binding protein [Streptomyces sp. CWNU-1]MCM2393338.1 ATP-binding protein [Streptomyces sp. CWNU-1]